MFVWVIKSPRFEQMVSPCVILVSFLVQPSRGCVRLPEWTTGMDLYNVALSVCNAFYIYKHIMAYRSHR